MYVSNYAQLLGWQQEGCRHRMSKEAAVLQQPFATYFGKLCSPNGIWKAEWHVNTTPPWDPLSKRSELRRFVSNVARWPKSESKGLGSWEDQPGTATERERQMDRCSDRDGCKSQLKCRLDVCRPSTNPCSHCRGEAYTEFSWIGPSAAILTQIKCLVGVLPE